MSSRVEDRLDRLLDGGLVPFRPTYVRRFYMDGGRLGLSRRPGGTYLPRVRLWRPERWIASAVLATNPFPASGEGASRVAMRGIDLSFREALTLRGERILGTRHYAAYGPEFPVLIKILDPAEPIIFHVHASDAHVRRHPERFPGQHCGKDEAYYFLPAPTGAVPYAHVGLHPGVSRRVLAEAIEQGRGTVLELSPAFHQRPGEGFYVPAGVPHRPGTALTLEIQQPSDVYTLLERVSGGRTLSAGQMHPGFASVEAALGLIDFKAATRPDLLKQNRLVPEPLTDKRTRASIPCFRRTSIRKVPKRSAPTRPTTAVGMPSFARVTPVV